MPSLTPAGSPRSSNDPTKVMPAGGTSGGAAGSAEVTGGSFAIARDPTRDSTVVKPRFARQKPGMRSLQRAGTAALLVSLQACNCDEVLIQQKPAVEQIDIFEQKAAAKVDILWIVDNSESMLS